MRYAFPVMKTRFAAWILLLAAATPGAALAAADHLKCFKVKDPQAKAKYLADLDGLVAQTGCTIKVPALLACVPSTKTNVQPVPPGGGGTGTPNAFACYKVKCPKGAVPPVVELGDQFGTRTVAPSTAKMVCAPVAMPTSTCTQAFEPRLQDMVDLFVRGFDAAGDLPVSSSCGGTGVCCPGGTPVAPCGPLHVDLTSASVAAPPGTDRFDVTYTMRVTTVADIPVTIPVIGECLMHIDTSAGPSPTIDLTVPLQFSPGYLQTIGAGSVAVTGLTTDDVAISGGFNCQVANLGLGLFVSTLTATFDDLLAAQFQQNLCRFCDSTIGPCP